MNHVGHQNPKSGSIVTAILLKGWILPIGGASAVEGLRSTRLPRLVLKNELFQGSKIYVDNVLCKGMGFPFKGTSIMLGEIKPC